MLAVIVLLSGAVERKKIRTSDWQSKNTCGKDLATENKLNVKISNSVDEQTPKLFLLPRIIAQKNCFSNWNSDCWIGWFDLFSFWKLATCENDLRPIFPDENFEMKRQENRIIGYVVLLIVELKHFFAWSSTSIFKEITYFRPVRLGTPPTGSHSILRRNRRFAASKTGRHQVGPWVVWRLAPCVQGIPNSQKVPHSIWYFSERQGLW